MKKQTFETGTKVFNTSLNKAKKSHRNSPNFIGVITGSEKIKTEGKEKVFYNVRYRDYSETVLLDQYSLVRNSNLSRCYPQFNY